MRPFKNLIDNEKTSVAELAQLMQCSKEKIYHLLSFADVPNQIWDAVTNMSNRVGGALQSPSSHTTVQALLHTAVPTKCLTTIHTAFSS